MEDIGHNLIRYLRTTNKLYRQKIDGTCPSETSDLYKPGSVEECHAELLYHLPLINAIVLRRQWDAVLLHLSIVGQHFAENMFEKFGARTAATAILGFLIADVGFQANFGSSSKREVIMDYARHLKSSTAWKSARVLRERLLDPA